MTYAGHLADDLKHKWTTPKFAFITPNLCDDGHDATCADVNDAGTTKGGLVGADDWLKTWMPLIFNSPAYRGGSTLVMLTFDEGAPTDTTAADNEQRPWAAPASRRGAEPRRARRPPNASARLSCLHPPGWVAD